MKKILALLLCLAMMVTVFAACGNGTTSSTPAESKTPASSQAAGNESSTPASEPTADVVNSTNPGTTLPIVTEPVTITIAKERHMLDTTKSYNEKPAFKNFTDETGVTLEFTELAAGTSGEKVPLMLAGGEMPDVFWALLSDTQILQNEDQLVPLEGMLETYAPNCLATYEALTSVDWRQIATTPSGHIYGMLGRYESLFENTGDGIQIINKKWLDAVGKEVPTTLEEYKDVLKAFKDGDPNGNGDPNDEVPYCFSEDMWCASLTNDMGIFGVGHGGATGDNVNTMLTIKDGKVEGAVNNDAYKEYLQFYHELYAEGLIDQEGFSQNTEVFSNKIKNDQVGTYYCWTALEYLTDEQEKDWVVLPTLHKDGVTPIANGEIDRSTIQKNKWVITSNCTHPEAALRVWDYMGRDAESKLTVALGEKGTLWDEYEDGSGYYFVVPTNTTPEFTFEHMKYTYGTVNDPPLMTIEETPKNDGEISPAAALRDNMVKEVNKDFIAKENQLPQIYVTPEATDERAFMDTDLYAYVKQFRAQAVTDGFTDADWDAYLKRLEELRYSDWLQWYQDYMDGNL